MSGPYLWAPMQGHPLNADVAERERAGWRRQNDPSGEREPMLCPIDGGVLVEMQRELGQPTRFTHYWGRTHLDLSAYLRTTEETP